MQFSPYELNDLNRALTLLERESDEPMESIALLRSRICKAIDAITWIKEEKTA